jgi:hypothetical protein
MSAEWKVRFAICIASVAIQAFTKSSYTAMPTARQKILSISWNVQFVVFNTSKKLNNNLENARMATEAMQIANLTFHSPDNSDRRATMILSAS